MKKTLALILAMLMILSVALVACGDKPEETEKPTDDFFDTPEDPTDAATGDETDDDEISGGINTPGSTFVEKNDTVYVCYNAVVREDAKASSKQVATAKFGVQLERIEANNKWSKVKVGEVVGYIANDLITTNEGAVKFTALEEPVASKITNLGTSKNANLRKFPLALSNPKVIDLEAFNSSCIIGQVAKDTEVTIISVSADGQWAYIKCMAKAAANGEFAAEATEMEGYCSIAVLDYKTAGEGGSEDFLG